MFKKIQYFLLEHCFRYDYLKNYVEKRSLKEEKEFKELKQFIKDTFDESSIKHFPGGFSIELPYDAFCNEN